MIFLNPQVATNKAITLSKKNHFIAATASTRQQHRSIIDDERPSTAVLRKRGEEERSTAASQATDDRNTASYLVYPSSRLLPSPKFLEDLTTCIQAMSSTRVASCRHCQVRRRRLQTTQLPAAGRLSTYSDASDLAQSDLSRTARSH